MAKIDETCNKCKNISCTLVQSGKYCPDFEFNETVREAEPQGLELTQAEDDMLSMVGIYVNRAHLKGVIETIIASRLAKQREMIMVNIDVDKYFNITDKEFIKQIIRGETK